MPKLGFFGFFWSRKNLNFGQLELVIEARNSKKGPWEKKLSTSKAFGKIIGCIEKNQFRILVCKDSKVMDFLYRLNPPMAVTMIKKR